MVRSGEPYPEWFKDLRQKINVHFIRANRLERTLAAKSGTRTRPVGTVVEAFAGELAGQINRTLADYAELSQQLDRSFPQRLVGGNLGRKLTLEEVKQRLDELEIRRNKLTEVGLLDKDEHAPFCNLD